MRSLRHRPAPSGWYFAASYKLDKCFPYVSQLLPIFLRNCVKPKKLVEDNITEGTPD